MRQDRNQDRNQDRDQDRDWTEDEAAAGHGSRWATRLSYAGFAGVVRRRRGRILLTTLAATVLAGAGSFLLRDNFESTTVILPPKPDQSISALLSGSAGGSALLSGGGLGAAGLGFKNPNELFLSLLASRTLCEAMVNQFDLRRYYHAATMEDAVKALQKHTATELTKDGLIRVVVTTHDPNFSADLANSYIDHLHTMNTGLALTESAQRRMFFTEQVNEEKDTLARAEAALAETESKTGILQPAGQAEMLTRNISALQQQITQREAALQSLGTFYTAGNPQYRQQQAELSSLRARLAQLQSSGGERAAGDVNVPTAQLPKASLEYLRKYRDVQMQEGIFAMLEKQLEAARIDESKTAPLIQVVDRAVPAERRSGPYRWLIALGVLLLALGVNLLVCGWIYLRQTLAPATPLAEQPAQGVQGKASAAV